MKDKFKDRYVLATGYPWGLGPFKDVQAVTMNKKPNGMDRNKIKYPAALWDESLPRYRLVLERVRRAGRAR